VDGITDFPKARALHGPGFYGILRLKSKPLRKKSILKAAAKRAGAAENRYERGRRMGF